MRVRVQFLTPHGPLSTDTRPAPTKTHRYTYLVTEANPKLVVKYPISSAKIGKDIPDSNWKKMKFDVLFSEGGAMSGRIQLSENTRRVSVQTRIRSKNG